MDLEDTATDVTQNVLSTTDSVSTFKCQFCDHSYSVTITWTFIDPDTVYTQLQSLSQKSMSNDWVFIKIHFPNYLSNQQPHLSEGKFNKNWE